MITYKDFLLSEAMEPGIHKRVNLNKCTPEEFKGTLSGFNWLSGELSKDGSSVLLFGPECDIEKWLTKHSHMVTK